jgi:hypothetical protein
LYFRADDLPAIRQKTRYPRFRRDWERILSEAEAALTGPALPEEQFQSAVLGEGGRRAGLCAFAYRITGWERFARRAREVMDALLNSDGWTYNAIPGQRIAFHLRTAPTPSSPPRCAKATGYSPLSPTCASWAGWVSAWTA